MVYVPLMLSRRHVLGDLYTSCDRFTSVPIFWDTVLGTRLGFVSESENYTDAFTFHIEEKLSKKLAAGQLKCMFNYEFASKKAKGTNVKRRLKLTSFVLSAREDLEGRVIKAQPAVQIAEVIEK